MSADLREDKSALKAATVTILAAYKYFRFYALRKPK